MLWFVNTILHAFGWAIVVELNDNGDIISCFPARVKFRGFDVKTNTRGYIALSEYLEQNIGSIVEEAKELSNPNEVIK